MDNNIFNGEGGLDYMVHEQNMSHTEQMSYKQPINDDDELLRAYIGQNYDKITTRRFNFAGLFFTTLYMFYRKMFLWAVCAFLVNMAILNFTDKFIIMFLFSMLMGIVIGFAVNTVYLHHARKKIARIKLQNPQKDINELKAICSARGGTSVGKMFLGLATQLLIALFIVIIMIGVGVGSAIGKLFDFDNWNLKFNETNTNNVVDENVSFNGAVWKEDVNITGYGSYGSTCFVIIKEGDNQVQYNFTANNFDYFNILRDYENYVKVDIYYTQKGDEKIIVAYKVFAKANNKEITNIKTEDELRMSLGLYSVGVHTDTFTFSKIDSMGVSSSGAYTRYIFLDNENNEYIMKYTHLNDDLNLVVGNNYNITFELIKGIFEYEYNIKSINN